MEHVTSRQNTAVKRFREVARRGRDAHDAVLVDGPHLVSEALDARVRFEVVAFGADVAAGQLAALASRCLQEGIRVITTTPSLLPALSPVTQPSGVVAIARLKQPTVEQAVAAGPPQLLLVLDRVQDPGNVGAIVRSAEACGGTAIIAGAGTADPYGWKALRGSMGSTFRLPVASAGSLKDAIDTARAAGLRVFATVPRGGTPLRRAALTGPSAIVVGGEGAGLADETIDRADEALTIEMRPPVESLNVGVAAALVMYEAFRQRTDVAV